MYICICIHIYWTTEGRKEGRKEGQKGRKEGRKGKREGKKGRKEVTCNVCECEGAELGDDIFRGCHHFLW
jgi:hypothetical protein